MVEFNDEHILNETEQSNQMDLRISPHAGNVGNSNSNMLLGTV